MGLTIHIGGKDLWSGGMTYKISHRVKLDAVIDDFFKEIMPKTMEKLATLAARDARDKIDSKTLKPLSSSTIAQRDKGVYWEGEYQRAAYSGVGSAGQKEPLFLKKGLKKITEDTPLKYTGNLYKSLKAHKSKDGKKTYLKGVDYALKHQKGYSVKGSALPYTFGGGTIQVEWDVPAREFIPKKANMEEVKVLVNKLIKESIGKHTDRSEFRNPDMIINM